MIPAAPPNFRPAPPIATWFAGALILLPLLQGLPIDFDRSAPLLVLLPALWSGRHDLLAAVAALGRCSLFVKIALAWLAAAGTTSVILSAHPAPSLVCMAGWAILAAAGATTGHLARRDARAGHRLLAGLALGAAAGAVIVWALWLAGGRGSLPFYAHHRIYGLHLLVGALATTALAVRTAPPAPRWPWLALGAITWGGLLWSGGRTPLLGLAAGLGTWFLLRANDRSRLGAALALQLVAGLALSALFWTPRPELGWWHALGRTAAATRGGAVDTRALTSTRNEFWRDSVRHALRSPWIGHGPDAYRFITPKLDGQQPHNVVLQLWLDVGVLGALPALALLGGALLGGGRRARLPETGAALAPWVALLAGLAVAGLLDGVFYHVLTLLPAVLALGVVAFAHGEAAPAPRASPTLTPGLLLAGLGGPALAALLVHAYLFHALAVAPPPSDPTAVAARILRMFPSTTFGLWQWLDHWHRTDPAAALAWARWAQNHANNPTLFHVRAAQYLQARGDHPAASEELRLAEEKAHWTTRPAIAELRKKMSVQP